LLPLATNNSAPAATTALAMQSDPGDWVGQGLSYHFDLSNSTFQVTPGLTHIAFYITPQPSTGSIFWYVDFDTSSLSTPLATGLYLDAERSPFQSSGHPGMDIRGDGRGSNTLNGHFEVLELDFSNLNAIKFAANFEQHSEGASPALYGQIRYNSTIPVPEPSTLLIAAMVAIVGLMRPLRRGSTFGKRLARGRLQSRSAGP
jgi:hypothetical protein